MKTILLASAIFISNQLSAQLYGPASCTSSSTEGLDGNSQSWTSSGNLYSSDDNYASFGNISGSAGNYTNYLVASDFGFNPPYGTEIRGIVVEIERSDPNGLTSDYSVRIVKAGLISSVEKSTGAAYPLTDANQTYGGSTDLWGESWSYKDIANNNFGVAIAAQRNAAGGITAGRVDNIKITVYFGALLLPVTLTSFTAVKENKAVQVNWKTASEASIDHYNVERSSNGRNFYSLTSISSQHQSTADYIYTDNSPFNGTSYYRLKIEGIGGEQKYSAVATIHLDSPNTIVLSPCPWTKGSDLFISNPKNEVLRIQFYTAGGQLISNSITTTDKVTVNNLSGIEEKLFYKVFDVKNQLLGSGILLVQ